MPSTERFESKRNIVWEPIANSSQELVLDTRAQHTLFTGTRGPGKSDTQLMRFKRRVGVGYGPFWRGIIFDREYKHLDDLVTKAKRWFHRFNDGAHWHGATNEYKWTWPTGEELLFRVMKTPDDYENYHGHEYPFIGWNELTKYPTAECYDMMMSCNRSSFTPEKDAPLLPTGERLAMDSIPLEVFSTTNSHGVGHTWVKQRFIDVAPYGKIVRTYMDVFSPKSQKVERVEFTQVAIFGSYKENIYLDPVYIAGLTRMCQTNENLRKAWLEGSWDIVAGGALDDVWDRSKHVLRRFEVPFTWTIDRAFDWGSSTPFSVGWFAEANGEEVTFKDGTTWCPPKGTLIQIDEWYGTKRLGSNEGIKLGPSDIAIGIKEREEQMLVDEWIRTQPRIGPADNQIREVKSTEEETLEQKMSEKGIRWEKSDKSPGSRRIGLELMRERLGNVLLNNGDPGLYFTENCKASVALIPILPRDETDINDVDTAAEDHPYDMVRYRVLKGAKKKATFIKVTMAH